MSKTNDELMMETMYWWGIPTLFRCNHQTNPSKCDIALVGVPHSSGNGTTERDQHLGPRFVRHVSAGFKRVHLDFGINPWNEKIIHDLGDVPLPEANDNEKCVERITNFYSEIANAKKPVVSIGGDHSITGGILQGLASNNLSLTKGQKISFLHIDAHTDTFNQLDHFLGAKKSAAHWGSYLVQNNIVDASSSMQIGIRGNPRTLDWLKPSYDLGYNVITMDEFRHKGLTEVIQESLEKLGNNPIGTGPFVFKEWKKGQYIRLDKNENLKGLAYLDQLYQAILKKICLKINYQSFKARTPTEFIFHPFILKEFNNRWFLIGKKDRQDQILTLALDRIISQLIWI